ncbi:UDP-N-acetylglucosamine 2-epimerase (non-hydrolyzing) [Flavobacteriaceae bacterium YJPT1-3]|nr:UDP-N-acetylglucosamine 2-epimerase (non-hydrolyzing) [Flavobacteriaceae bacterium YJPT1-3]
MNVLAIFGTRPEAIKMAPVVLALLADDRFEVKVCVTAQHREMLDQVLDFFQITPDYDLAIMEPGQQLEELTARMLLALKPVLKREKTDWVLVHGDTTTCFVAALAAFYQQIKVAHVEAGLRTHDLYSPFPEEANRQLVSLLAALHLAPTQQAAENLYREGKPQGRVVVTGNTVVDALFLGLDRIEEDFVELESFKDFLDPDKKLILVTGHRRENFGKPQQEVLESLKVLADRPDTQLIFPVHLNPMVQHPVEELLGNHKHILLCDPVPYEVFLWLMKRSHLIITDSGGIQEEAPSLKKPVLVTRSVTERKEALESGAVQLVGTDQQAIVQSAKRLLEDPIYYAKITEHPNPYGDGQAAKRILNALLDFE